MGFPAQLITLARRAAAAQSLDPALVCAIVEQESAWNPWAMRFEPLFFAKYVASLYTNNKVSASEAYARGFSWGLMQVMGQVARESGFDALFLSTLCDPEQAWPSAAKSCARNSTPWPATPPAPCSPGTAAPTRPTPRKSSPAACITYSGDPSAFACLFKDLPREVNEVKEVKDQEACRATELACERSISYPLPHLPPLLPLLHKDRPCPHENGFASLNLLPRSCSP